MNKNLPQRTSKILRASTYCQIVGHDISVETCLATQGQEGCAGCASPHRLCEECRETTVVLPAIGLCSRCLKLSLAREKKTGKRSFNSDFRVPCQLLTREITAPMCEATQGQEGCFNCPALTRICEVCKQHPVALPRFGLCLSCTVNEFGSDWQNKPIETEEGLAVLARGPKGVGRETVRETAPARVGFSMETKIKRLEGLARAIGDGKVLTQVIRQVIRDLRELEAMKNQSSSENAPSAKDLKR